MPTTKTKKVKITRIYGIEAYLFFRCCGLSKDLAEMLADSGVLYKRKVMEN